jgi:hypothetical protein
MTGSGRTKWGTKIVLVVLAAACAGGASYARSQQATLGSRAESDATTTAASYLTVDLTKALKRWAPDQAPDKLRHELEAVVLADPNVTAVRVFDTEGALVFSSVASDATVAAPAIVQAALSGGGSVDDSDSAALRTYAPAGGFVGEIEQDAAEIRGAATLPWMIGQFGGIGVAIVLLGAALFAGNGTKAPKKKKKKQTASTSDAPAKQTKNELEMDDPELAKLRARAEKAEQSRRAMEDQLNTLRSQILSGDAGSQGRVNELEGLLKDAHSRVSQFEASNAVLTSRVNALEAAAEDAAPAVQRAAALEAEIATTTTQMEELASQLRAAEARAASAENAAAEAKAAAATHAGQADEARVSSQQTELQVQEAVDRALAAERRADALEAQLGANGQGTDEQVRRLQEQLAAAASSGGEHDGVLRDAVARAESAEQLLAAAQSQIAAAEARAAAAESAARTGAAPVTPAEPVTESGVRELEIALADARAAAWEAQPEVGGPSLGVVETHAVPEDEEAVSEAPHEELGEADAIRAELERMGQIVEHAGEAGDVEGLRGRLAKTAARKKGRSAVDDRISRSS